MVQDMTDACTACMHTLLDIYKINSLHIGKFMFSHYNKLLPSSFLKLFTPSNRIHHYNTRNANLYRPHACIELI